MTDTAAPLGPTGENCNNCKFYQKGVGRTEKMEGAGECHRYAPAPIQWNTNVAPAMDFSWPVLKDNDWCGEWYKVAP